MHPGWTGGQFSLLRVVVGLFCIAPFVQGGWLAPTELWAEEALAAQGIRGLMPVTGVLALVLIPLLVAGWRTRLVALLLALLVISRVVVPPHVPPTWLFLSVCLAVVALHPPAPYLSVAARGREDPGGGWHRPAWLHHFTAFLPAFLFPLAAVLRLVPIGGLAGLAPEADSTILARQCIAALAFLAPGLMVRRFRRRTWVLLLTAWLALVGLGVPARELAPLLLLLLLAAEPGWLRGQGRRPQALLLYDGTCGLCHGTVRFLLAEGADDHALSVAPLGGPTANAALPTGLRAKLPDSVVLIQSTEVLVRADAVAALLRRLPGLWPIIGWGVQLTPRWIANPIYDAVARHRHRFVRTPQSACPVAPSGLQARLRP